MSSTAPHTPSTGKGYDDSPPRNGTIFFYTMLTVFLLLCVKILLDSYFVKMMDLEIEAKVLTQGMEEVSAMRADEEKQKAAVDAAMKTLSTRGRAGVPQLAPAGGAGKPEVEGWRELRHAPAAPAPAEVVPAAGPGGAGATTENPAVPAPPAAKPGAPGAGH